MAYERMYKSWPRDKARLWVVGLTKTCSSKAQSWISRTACYCALKYADNHPNGHIFGVCQLDDFFVLLFFSSNRILASVSVVVVTIVQVFVCTYSPSSPTNSFILSGYKHFLCRLHHFVFCWQATRLGSSLCIRVICAVAAQNTIK